MAKQDKMTAPIDVSITQELKDTVAKNPLIKEVYFDEKGNHFFKKHTIELYESDAVGVETGRKKVESLPGAKFGIVKVKQNIGGFRDKRVNVSHTQVAKTMTREEVLGA